MTLATCGLHHVTAIASDPGRNADFYTRVLSLCLIKRTVKFDEPDVYHLYYGDAFGRPGTLVTFFARRGGPAGRVGSRQATCVRFNASSDNLESWRRRLGDRSVAYTEAPTWFGARAISFADPDGLPLQIVAAATQDRTIDAAADEPSIRSLHSVELSVPDPEATTALLIDQLGFRKTRQQLPWHGLTAADAESGSFVDVRGASGTSSGVMGAGCVHHVAFRAATDDDQRVWQDRLRQTDVDVTDIRDRKYFRSIYFHEPNGIRFEIATDAPGFAVDEPPDQLGRRLQLPFSLEASRRALEAGLSALSTSSA